MTMLEPCPFCGGDADIEQFGDSRKSHIVACQYCGCFLEANEMPWAHNTAHNTAWNTRTPDPRIAELEAESERLRDALKELVACEEDGCFCSEMRMSAAVDNANAALTPKETDK